MIKEKFVASPSLLEKMARVKKQVGNTPLHHFSKLFVKKNVSVYAKKEWKQLGGSVKSRAAYYIFRQAIEQGRLTEKKTLLDATSGNTGIAYAAIGKELGIRVTLCLPENASKERKEILKGLGAEIVYTSKFEGTDGAQQVANELAEKNPYKYFYADQYKNNGNWEAHYNTTAVEIYNKLPDITHFVAGLGTSGTFVGTGRRLKVYDQNIHLTSLQPDSAMHALEGWKHMETAVVPKIYDPFLADDELEISTEEAFDMLRLVLKLEGLLVSPSAAANLVGALKIADRLDSGTIVTILADDAEKYTDIITKLF